MKNLEMKELECVVNLSQDEMIQVDGGKFWEAVGECIGAFIGGCVVMGNNAKGNPHF